MYSSSSSSRQYYDYYERLQGISPFFFSPHILYINTFIHSTYLHQYITFFFKGVCNCAVVLVVSGQKEESLVNQSFQPWLSGQPPTSQYTQITQNNGHTRPPGHNSQLNGFSFFLSDVRSLRLSYRNNFFSFCFFNSTKQQRKKTKNNQIH